MDFGLPKLVEDNSSAEGLLKQNQFDQKKQEELDNNVLYGFNSLEESNCMSFQI
jgi:hypothetical protein